GVMAIGRRPTPPALLDCLGDGSQPSTMLICPEVINHDNLGALIRIAAGFGASAMLVGPNSCDPYWRRSVSVSMGTVFSLPVVRSADVGRDLRLLRQQAGMALVATVLDDEAVPLSEGRRADLPREGGRGGVLVGSE